VVGDAQTVVIAAFDSPVGQDPFDAGPGTEHQHQPNPQTVEQRDVVQQVGKPLSFDGLVGERNDEGAAAKGVDIGGGVTEPGDERG